MYKAKKNKPVVMVIDSKKLVGWVGDFFSLLISSADLQN